MHNMFPDKGNHSDFPVSLNLLCNHVLLKFKSHIKQLNVTDNQEDCMDVFKNSSVELQ